MNTNGSVDGGSVGAGDARPDRTRDGDGIAGNAARVNREIPIPPSTAMRTRTIAAATA
jgi:hypothetical protein